MNTPRLTECANSTLKAVLSYILFWRGGTPFYWRRKGLVTAGRRNGI